jgi:outer membrane protein assembly complex protein YaeT
LPLRTIRAAGALALVAAAWTASLAVPAVRAQDAGELPDELRTVAGVRFHGLHHLGVRQLRAAGLRTRRPSRLPWREKPLVRRDYLRADSAAIVSLYRHYGYLDTRVGVELLPGRDPRSAIVQFDVTEGPVSRISKVELAGVNNAPENELRRALLAQPRRPFDPAFLQLDVLKIRTLYLERGFLAHVDTTARRGVPDSAHVQVRYGVDEGPQYRVGSISYRGTGRLRESLGRRELLLHPGDVFRRSRLDLSVEHLYATGLFRQVQVSTPVDSANGRLDLQVRVQERPPRWVDLGIGSGTSDRFRATAQWGHRNLDTRALGGVLDGELAWYGNGRPHKSGVAATLTEPWLLGVRLLGSGGVFYREQHDAAFDSLGNSLYTQHTDSRGFSFSLYRELSRISRLTLLQESAQIHQRYSFDLPSSQLPDSTKTRLESQTVPRYRTNLVHATLERDLRNDRINPSRGSYQVLVGEFAGGWLKGQTRYRKTTLTSTWYSPRPNGWLFVARAMGGLMEPFGPVPENLSPDLGLDSQVARVPREARFFIGGANSLRGYSENAVPQDGGLAVLLTNLEMRVPVAGPFGMEFFLDGGNVWDRAEYIRSADFVLPWQATRARRDDLRWSYGAGLRLELPFGPLRVDLSRSDRPDFPFAVVRHHKMPFTYQFEIGPSF